MYVKKIVEPCLKKTLLGLNSRGNFHINNTIDKPSMLTYTHAPNNIFIRKVLAK